MNRRVAASLALAATIGVACALRDTRLGGAGLPCNSSTQCSSDSVCFLGECRGSSSQLTLVEAEVRAPASEQLGSVQRSAIDLRVSPVVDFQLRPLLTASGTVVRRLDDGGVDSVADAGVVLTASSPPIADRVQSVATQTDTSGAFALSFPDSTWNLLVAPPAPEPPVRPAPPVSPLSTTATGLQVVIPARRELTSVASTLLTGGAPLAGARVAALDANGSPLSVPAITDAQGAFTLALPPPPVEYFLQVGPDPSTPNASPAVPAFPARGPFSSPAPGFACSAPTGNCLELGALPAPATLSGTVVDSGGQPIASIAVFATSIDPTGWVISRQTSTDSTGAFTLALRTGSYAIEAVPAADPASPGLSGEQQAVAPSASPVTLVCPDKSQATGVVLRADGQRGGSGYQVTATHVPDRLVTGRIASATATDGTGSFTIVGDPGQYRVEIVPPAASGLPRKIVALDLPAAGTTAALPPVQLSAPLAVVGTVTKPANAPVPGVTVDFFALDASGVRSVLIGSGLTDSLGRYRAVLPDVAAPAAQVATR
jgi:hypothetical protein